jgi:TfoX/Sxy family transcriptional regulator of competence genes
MAFDEGLAERIRSLTRGDPSISERKMFGGLSFLSSGNMCFGIVGSEIMVRVGPAAYQTALRLPHAREMDFTGRSMRGMVYVDSEGIAEDDDLEAWLRRGLGYAESLPAKI